MILHITVMIGNDESELRDGVNGNVLVLVHTNFILECDQYNSFWMDWTDGILRYTKNLFWFKEVLSLDVNKLLKNDLKMIPLCLS